MPKSMLTLISLVLILLFITIFFLFRPLKTTQLIINHQSFTLEIASNPITQAQGLSNRHSLCQNCGMIFKMGFDAIHPFWMKDTLIPLDIIWLTQEGIVTDIVTANPEPDKTINELTLYRNTKPARYIIELNAKTAQSLNLKVGDKINLP